MTPPHRLGLLVLSLLPALLGFAQPRPTAWVEGSKLPVVLSLVEDCDRPPSTVLAGDSIFFEIDTVGGYGASVTIGEDSRNQFGRPVVVSLGASLRYAAFTDIGLGGIDTVPVVACRADGVTCRTTEFFITVAEVGRRADTSLAIRGGDVVEVPILRPAGELFCESITTRGAYEAVERREAILLPDGPLRYASSRVPGVDELQVVACGVSGVCDTTYVVIDVLAETLELPICDDFSGERGRPDPRLWLEDDVSLGDGFVLNAPSIGAATFDGLDARGRPYGTGFGPSDALTSTTLALGGDVAEPHLKYFVQIGGRGQAPERTDALYVEGRRDDGSWETLMVHRGSPSSTPDSNFRFFALPLNDSDLRHDKFQVRFRAEGNRAGENDIWNLDYVRVESGGDSTFADIAVAAPPADLFAPYTAVPYEHFVAQPTAYLAEATELSVYNHFAQTNNVSSTRVTARAADGTLLLDEGLLFGQQLLLEPGLTTVRNAISADARDDLARRLAGLDRAAASTISTQYVLGIDTDQEQLPCVLRNDTATATARLGDEFAYDDGTAEAGLQPGGSGEYIVQRFEAAVEDTLRGIRLRFPRLGPLDADEQLINLRVYIGELDDTPEYADDFVQPFFPQTPNGEQAFTTFRLEDFAGEPVDLIIPPGPFYVGWQQGSDVEEPVPVGVDLSRDATAETFVNFANEWVALDTVLPSFRGALMVRPVFSAQTPGNSSGVADAGEVDATSFKITPNPTHGPVSLTAVPPALGATGYTLHDLAGRMLRSGPFELDLDLSGVPAGFYVLVLRDGGGRAVARGPLVVE